jgi:hypothetical protein
MIPTPEEDPWVRREPGFLELRIELMRMYRRARRRPFLTIFVALLMAAGVCVMRSFKKSSFAASVTFRVSEVQEGEEYTTPRPVKEIREYVQSVALRSTRLVELMEKRGLYKNLLADDPVTAVDFLRSDIEVEVVRNYFIEEWQTNKSARLVITYTGGTAEEAALIATDLGDLVVEEEQRRRNSVAQAAAADARELVTFAQSDVDKRYAEIARLEATIPDAKGEEAATMKLDLEYLKKSLEPATERLMKAEKTRANLELAVVLEMHDLGVRFDKVDERVLVVSRHPELSGLLVLGGFIFVLSLPFAVMFVGAFDSRVYDLDDVNRLGLRGLGHVPPFRGSQVGSLAERARASGRV